MNRIRFPRVVAGAAALVLALAPGGRVALAEPPEPVIRTFAVWVPPSWASSEIPDFLSEDSETVTVLPEPGDPQEPPATASVQFTSNDDCSELAGTTWYRHPTHHATRAAQAELPFFWLDSEETPSPPPVGAHTFTGPDSPFVISMTVYRIKQCVAGDGCCSSADISAHRYRTVPWSMSVGSDGYFVVVEAWFSRGPGERSPRIADLPPVGGSDPDAPSVRVAGAWLTRTSGTAKKQIRPVRRQHQPARHSPGPARDRSDLPWTQSSHRADGALMSPEHKTPTEERK